MLERDLKEYTYNTKNSKVFKCTLTDFCVPGKIIIQNSSLMYAARNWLKFLSDLKEWVNHLILMNYGDDTSLSHRGYNMNTMLENLEEDVTNILQFMALNGLVANPNMFMLYVFIPK